MRKILAEKISEQVHDWGHRGLVDDELHARLLRRYSADVSQGRVLLSWLGFFALFMLGSSVLGLIGLALGEAARLLAPFVVAAISWLLWKRGAEMATDPEQRFPISGAVLVTAGLIAAFATLVMLYGLIGGDDFAYAIPAIGILITGMAVFAAYWYGLRWPLTLGV